MRCPTAGRLQLLGGPRQLRSHQQLVDRHPVPIHPPRVLNTLQIHVRDVGLLNSPIGDHRGSLLDADVVDDAQQEVWLTVYRSMCGLANPGAFRTWLYRMTRRRAIDRLRRRKRYADLLQAAAEEATGPLSEVAFPPLELPSLPLAMAQLSPVHREVLHLRFWEEMAYGEIALVLGCSVGTVRSRLHHAKRRLRLALVEDS